MTDAKNVLFIVIDQLRADCVFGALANSVDMPNIRALADDAVSFRSHYTVLSPCGPSRVSLLSGRYGMNHGAMRNGSPVRHDMPNVATEARKAGYEPLLFGYTDHTLDPRVTDPDDARLKSYEEVANGFTEVVRMRQDEGGGPWEEHLRSLGIDPDNQTELYRPQGGALSGPAVYTAKDSDTAFLTDKTIEHLSDADPGWFEADLPAQPQDDRALIAFSSGTTGRPKGVMLPHRAPTSVNGRRKRRTLRGGSPETAVEA